MFRSIMKNKLHLISCILLLYSCTELQPTRTELPEGKFYAKEWRHSDTLVFKPYTSGAFVGGWSELYWTIHGDSILQHDTRGMTYYFGKEQCTYWIENDTLTLLFKGNEQNNKEHATREALEEKYTIESVNDTLIQLVKINPPMDREEMSKQGRGDSENEIRLR